MNYCQTIVEINCSDPGAGVNVERTDGRDWLYNSEVIYLCPVGHLDNFTRMQSVSLKCQANKTWSLPEPSCAR